jgi:hypothetical protein
MLRMALKKKKSKFEDLRNMLRKDRDDLDWLIKIGFIADAGDGNYELTPAGVEASDMGYYEMDLGRKPAPAPEPEPEPEPAPKKGKGKGKGKGKK